MSCFYSNHSHLMTKQLNVLYYRHKIQKNYLGSLSLGPGFPLSHVEQQSSEYPRPPVTLRKLPA